jgi:hypothetical protein
MDSDSVGAGLARGKGVRHTAAVAADEEEERGEQCGFDGGMPMRCRRRGGVVVLVPWMEGGRAAQQAGGFVAVMMESGTGSGVE